MCLIGVLGISNFFLFVLVMLIFAPFGACNNWNFELFAVIMYAKLIFESLA